jgi:hypothetical protein
MASLVVLRGPTPGLRVALEKQETVFGRAPDCDVPIPINCVSRRHASITQFVLRDLGSMNGTFLDNLQIRGLCPLQNGDRVRLCDFLAVFESPVTPVRDSDWQGSSDPQVMMAWLRGLTAVSRRKSSLLVAACRRRFRDLDEQFSAELAERVAEEADWRGMVLEEFGDGFIGFRVPAGMAWEAAVEAVAVPLNRTVVLERRERLRGTDRELWAAFDAATGTVCQLLRCVFGNPFRPRPTIDPAWLRWNDGTVPRLAWSIDEGRRFGDLPILHDALLDAGCDNEDILDHCKAPGPHVRGCWVLDLLLGRE